MFVGGKCFAGVWCLASLSGNSLVAKGTSAGLYFVFVYLGARFCAHAQTTLIGVCMLPKCDVSIVGVYG